MPETGAAVAEWWAAAGTAAEGAGAAEAVGAGATAAEVGGGAAAAAGAGATAADLGTVYVGVGAGAGAAGGLTAADLAAGAGAAGGAYGASEGFGDGSQFDMGQGAGDVSTGQFGDPSGMPQSDPSAFGPNTTPSGSDMSWDDLFKKGGTLNNLFKNGGQAMGAAQLLTGLYGLSASKRLQQQSAQPGMTAQGLQAVQRSMAAQGYQGSGNMMTALEKYGAQTNMPNLPGTEAALGGQLGSLAMLTNGVPKLFGWGS